MSGVVCGGVEGGRQDILWGWEEVLMSDEGGWKCGNEKEKKWEITRKRKSCLNRVG